MLTLNFNWVIVKRRYSATLSTVTESAAEKVVIACLDALEGGDFEKLRTFLSDGGFFY